MNDTTPTLHRLLEANLALPPEPTPGITSHLPMALHALQSLGAGEARLQAFFDAYRGRLEGGRRHAPAAPVDDWRALLGDDDAFAPLQATFAALLARDGEEVTLRQVLPVLLQGVAAAAFHGAIRTAHAVEAGHRGELAAALAYWGWRWQPLLAAPPGETLPFEAWAARLIAESPAWTMQAPLISLRMAGASESQPYRALAGRLAPSATLLPQLAELAVARYAETRNFTVLHMVTGLRAVRVLSPWLAADDAQARVLVHAFTAAYLAARLAARAAPPHAPQRSWDEAAAAALAQDDDHVIKIVHACRAEAAVYGEGRYLEAARVAVA
jgi:hypothetical protein